MNQKQTTELTVVERAALALGTSEREASLHELVAKSITIVEIKNGAARDQAHGALMTLRNTRTDITKAGKAARDDANAFSKAVIAEEKRLVSIIEPEEARLQTLRDAWDEAREAEKRAAAEKEAKRIAAIRADIDRIHAFARVAVGMNSTAISVAISTLEAQVINVERFADLTGEAEAARGETLDKLAKMLDAAIAQEAEAQRLADERAELERQRAELEAQRRRDEEARAEQERKDAEARAAREAEERAAREAREAEERAQREREEAARREQQAREDAQRRAAIEAEEKRLAEERAEMARRQAELDRFEAERREREAQAAREMAEAAAQAERDRVARENEKNRSAMLAPEPTGGNWKVGPRGGCVVTDVEIAGSIGGGHNDVDYYGGHLIAESIYRPADAQLISASHDMYKALERVQLSTEWSCMESEIQDAVTNALAKATYIPTEATDLKAA